MINGQWSGYPLPQLDAVKWEERKNLVVPEGCPSGAEVYFTQLLVALKERGSLVLPDTVASGYLGDLVDQATNNEIAMSMAYAQNDVQEAHLNRIETALRLMAVGWDGKTCLGSSCRRTGRKIPDLRRQTVPGTMLCVVCKDQLEKGRIPMIELVLNEYSHLVELQVA